MRYEEKYEKEYGIFRLERITHCAETLLTCGDYITGSPEYNAQTLIAGMAVLGHPWPSWHKDIHVQKYFRPKMLRDFPQQQEARSLGENLLSWENSGFSIDNSIRLYGTDKKARESLA